MCDEPSGPHMCGPSGPIMIGPAARRMRRADYKSDSLSAFSRRSASRFIP